MKRHDPLISMKTRVEHDGDLAIAILIGTHTCCDVAGTARTPAKLARQNTTILFRDVVPPDGDSSHDPGLRGSFLYPINSMRAVIYLVGVID